MTANRSYPAPNPKEWSAQQPWISRGACRDSDPALFQAEDKFSIELAKRVCMRCPVLSECRAWSIPHSEAGTWGALSESERTTIRHASTPVRLCGTRAAAELHRRLNEPLDPACQDAWDHRVAVERERGRRRRAERRGEVEELAS